MRKYSDDQIEGVLRACIDCAKGRSTRTSAKNQVSAEVPSYPVKNLDGEIQRVALYLTGRGRFGFKFPANWARVFIRITNQDLKVIEAFKEQQTLYEQKTGKRNGKLDEVLSNLI